VLAQPPYVPVFDSLAEFPEKLRELSFENYRWLWQNALYWNAYLSSVWIAGLSAIITLAVGFPIAYGMARAPKRIRTVLLVLVILPFWTSFLIRVYAWIAILRPEGLLNQFLLWAVSFRPRLRSATRTQLSSSVSSIPICRSWFCRFTLPSKGSTRTCLKPPPISAHPRSATFWLVTAPLAIPGVAAGTMLVFIPAVGEFVIPDLLGGSETLMIGRTLWSEFFQNRDWPVASAVAVLLLLLLVLPIVLFQNVQSRLREASR
jgi:putrescine transport system permease protein